MFTKEEADRFMGVLRMETKFIEIECHCSLRRFGDSFGKLRIFTNGKLEIDCCCFPECPKVKLSPIQFAKHIGKNTTIDNWKKHLRVMDTKGKRVPLEKTNLLRYHYPTFQRPSRGPIVHRDEFIRCSKCNKVRRFSLQTKEKCRIYHDAFLKQDWQCSDMPNVKITCDDAEQRTSQKQSRRCPRKPQCKGCIRCVCTGCSMCRYEDCECRICTDFTQNK